MSAAIQAGTMPASTELNEIACPDQQKLPGSDAAVTVAAADSRERKIGGVVSEAAAVTPSGPGQPGFVSAGAEAGEAPVGRADPSVSHAGAAAEAVRRAIDTAAAGLGRAEGGSVSLILRPDPNTQLALHVKLEQGHIEALAVVEHGDLAALGAGWTHLQSRLAEQGVRLAPLVPGSEHSTSLLGGGSHRPGQERQPEPSAPATPEFNRPVTVRAAAPAPAAGSQSTAGQREWWA
jgi:hypothetical protein